jgi:hypothetical protein
MVNAKNIFNYIKNSAKSPKTSKKSCKITLKLVAQLKKFLILVELS